jgi:TIR domain
MNGDRVFISYSRADRSFVDRLSQDLRAGGVSTWQDTTDIQAGENWRSAIEESLRQTAVLLYVASANAAQSKWMTVEVEAVVRHGTRVIPLILDDRGEKELPPLLKQYQWVDFRATYDEALAMLLTALKPFRAAEPVAPSTQQVKGYVFLSYAEEDASFVDHLKEFLRGRRYGYWDYRESDRDYHQDLFLELEGVIQDAAATLSFLSPEWKRSRTAIQEYHFSIEVGIPVFLLRVRDPGPTLVIAGLPYIDFTEDRSAGLRRLDKELSRKGL